MHSQIPNPNHILPKDIIEEILSRLPVKSLVKFRCVSKSWLSLIKSDRFIKLHLKNSRKNKTLAHHRIVFNENSNAMNACSLPSLLNPREGSSSSSSIIIDPTNDQPEAGFVVGCYNGVLCLTSNYADGDFSLSNPATKVSVELPKLDYIFPICGFGWDESTAAFKLFASTIPDCLNDKRSSQVYSSKTNSWKPVPHSSLKGDSLFFPFGVFVGGRLHWAMGRLPDDEHVIVSFNLEDDEFGKMELPPLNANAREGSRPRTWLGEIGGCLCTLFDYEQCLDLWVMKEYGVKDSWFKLHTFPLSVSEATLFAFPLVIEEGPSGEIFIIYRHNFMVYSPKDDVLSTATNTIAFYGAHIYVESLVSPQTNTR